MGEDVAKVVGLIVMGLVMIFVFALLMAFPTKWLWNWLMTDLFNLQTINVWQALGLNILTGLWFRTSNSYKSKDK